MGIVALLPIPRRSCRPISFQISRHSCQFACSLRRDQAPITASAHIKVEPMLSDITLVSLLALLFRLPICLQRPARSPFTKLTAKKQILFPLA
jgi:hypothetical protein